MPPLNKEVLRQIQTGEITDRLKFARFRFAEEWDRKVLSKLGRPTATMTVGQVVYYTTEENSHSTLVTELKGDIAAGKLTFPEGISWGDEDAGRIRKSPEGAVIFYDHSSDLDLGYDPGARRETRRFVQEEIVGSDIPIKFRM